MEDLEILQGDPIKRWEEIIFGANRSIVAKELQRLLECLAFFEFFLEKEDLESKMQTYYTLLDNQEMRDLIKKYKNDIAITSMTKILSQNE